MDAGRVIYCVDIIYWYLRILEILSANKYLGPLVMMMGKMIKNMAYFVVLLLVVLMAFGVCRQSILFPNEEPHWRLARHIFYQPYFMLYGEVFADDIDPHCGGEGEIPCHPGRWVTPTVMSMYLLVANILLINLLIAVFNNIFTSVNAISHQVWMFQRFQVVMEFESKPVFPPPLIVFSHIYRIVKYGCRRWKGKPFFYDNGLKLFLDVESLERVHDFEEECMNGFNREKELKEQMSTEERVRVMAERTEGIMQKIEDMQNKFIAAMSSFNNLDFHVKRLEETVEQTKNSYAVVHRFMLGHVGRKGSSRSGSATPRSDGGETPRSLSQTSLHQLLEETARQMRKRPDPDPEPETSDKEMSDTTDAEFEGSTSRKPHKPTSIELEMEKSFKSSMSPHQMEDFELESAMASNQARAAKSRSRPAKTRLDSESGSSLGRASRERKLSGGRKSSIRKSRKGSDENKPFSPSRVCFVEAQIAGDDSDSGDPVERHLEQEDTQLRYRRSMSPPDETIHASGSYERSHSSVSSRPRIQVIPPSSPPPMFTFTSEYTSLADELETVCMARLTPPCSPLDYNRRVEPQMRRRFFSESAGISITISSNPLKDAEEADYQLMEGLIQRRMHRDSENLAVSLEDLCSIRTDCSDTEDGAIQAAAAKGRRGSRILGLRKRHSTTSIDRNTSERLSVPPSFQYNSSQMISPTNIHVSLICDGNNRLVASQPVTPSTRRYSLQRDVHHQWSSSSAIPVTGGGLTPAASPRPSSPASDQQQFQNPKGSTEVPDNTDLATNPQNSQPNMLTLQVPSIEETEARPRDIITETEC